MKGQRLKKVFNTIEDCPPRYLGGFPNRFVNIEGETYNNLKVLYPSGVRNGRFEWVCKCLNCGRYVITNSHNIRNGHTKSCGCLVSQMLRNDLTDMTFGTLYVIGYDKSVNENPYWKVKCNNCGREYSVCGDSLKRQLSCGCIKSQKEKVLTELFKNSQIAHHNTIEREKTFDDCVFKNKLRFDFYCPKSTTSDAWLLEYDGEQHFRPVKFSTTSDSESYKNFISTQVRDWYKDYYCIQHNIHLIRIPYVAKKIASSNELLENAYIVGKSQMSDNKIDVLGLMEQDFVNYREPSFNISVGISCTFKCCKDNISICQNSECAKLPKISTTIDNLIDRYLSQNISKAITLQGLEPLDNLKQVLWLIYHLREKVADDIIIWTGYTEEECEDLIFLINKMKWENITIKFGRFVPNQKPHYDGTLGVYLASDNQFAVKYNPR